MDIFLTSPMSRQQCIDIAFTIPVFSALNNLDAISNAWLDSKSISVSYFWADLLHSFRNNPLMPDDNGLYLSSNSIQRMLAMETASSNLIFQPVVQIVCLKRIPPTTETKWKIVITDGEQFHSGIVASHLNHLVEDFEIKRYTIIRLLEFVAVTTPNGYRIFVLLGIETVCHHVRIVGNPLHS